MVSGGIAVRLSSKAWKLAEGGGEGMASDAGEAWDEKSPLMLGSTAISRCCPSPSGRGALKGKTRMGRVAPGWRALYSASNAARARKFIVARFVATPGKPLMISCARTESAPKD